MPSALLATAFGVVSATTPSDARRDGQNGVLVETTLVAPVGTGARAYVAQAGDGTISVIDLATLEEVERWSVGEEASHGLALLTGFADGLNPSAITTLLLSVGALSARARSRAAVRGTSPSLP